MEAIDDSHLDDLTDIILIGSLAGFDTEGRFNLSRDFEQILTTAREKIGDRPIRLHLNLFGPWATANGTFDENMYALGEVHRQAFASGVLEGNIRSVLDTYNLDGVFFDYEFPVAQVHKDAFSKFLVSLKKVLGDDYVLGAAQASWCAKLSRAAIRSLDMVEVMSYDVWDEGTGLHSSFEITRAIIKGMRKLGYKREQLDVGIPFYARPTTEEPIWYDYKEYYDKIDENGYAPDEAVHGFIVLLVIIPIRFLRCRPRIKGKSEVDLLLGKPGFQHFLYAALPDTQRGVRAGSVPKIIIHQLHGIQRRNRFRRRVFAPARGQRGRDQIIVFEHLIQRNEKRAELLFALRRARKFIIEVDAVERIGLQHLPDLSFQHTAVKCQLMVCRLRFKPFCNVRAFRSAGAADRHQQSGVVLCRAGTKPGGNIAECFCHMQLSVRSEPAGVANQYNIRQIIKMRIVQSFCRFHVADNDIGCHPKRRFPLPCRCAHNAEQAQKHRDQKRNHSCQICHFVKPPVAF
ncbi:MAG: glycoside hydrolase family 18 protein [Clostridia bacterium]|nr:glycoside hydrolase family 18 protein [Clostridia bacterium]